MAGMHLVRTVHAVAVSRAWPDPGQVSVPDVVGFFEIGARGFVPPGRIVETQLNALGMLGKEREIGALAVPGGTERIGMSGFSL